MTKCENLATKPVLYTFVALENSYKVLASTKMGCFLQELKLTFVQIENVWR
jgi:hypothetical protein